MRISLENYEILASNCATIQEYRQAFTQSLTRNPQCHELALARLKNRDLIRELAEEGVSVGVEMVSLDKLDDYEMNHHDIQVGDWYWDYGVFGGVASNIDDAYNCLAAMHCNYDLFSMHPHELAKLLPKD